MFLTSPLVAALDVVSLTMTVVNVASPRGNETDLADQLEDLLRAQRHLRVERSGDTVVAHTDLGRPDRVALIGHIDTAPYDGEILARVEMGRLYGPGACAKGGIAVMLKMAVLGSHARDVTFVFAAGAAPVVTADATLLVATAFGPEVPETAGTPAESVPTAQLTECEHAVRTWLQTPS